MPLMKRKRAGLGDAMSVVTRFVNACNRHDADAVYACLHPDFDSIQPMFPARNFRGADQVRRNWQAIFDAEPGFRLTVLRSAAADDTVWLELHGAGRDAEVAGVFVMGIQGDRIRWARIYSGLVEPVPAGADGGSASATAASDVPRPDQPAAAGNGEVVEEALIAPVVDIERSGRRRRRRRHGDEADEPETVPVSDTVGTEGAEVAEAAGAEATATEPADVTEVVEPSPVPESPAEPEPAPTAHSEAGADPEPVVTEMITADPEPEVVVDPEPDPPAEVTAAHDMLAELEAEPERPEADAPPPVAEDPPPDDQPKRRFGKWR